MVEKMIGQVDVTTFGGARLKSRTRNPTKCSFASMADAFFMHQFIMKQDVDFACAAYFFGVSPASASRYMITISAILDEFLTASFRG